MKMPGKSLVLLYLAAASGSAAQGIGVTPFAPSAVNDASPLTQPLAGTLFFGQQQRDQMDRARKFGAITVTGVSGEPAPSVLNGFVKRSDGISTVWVDGAYKSMNDVKMTARIQSTSVGMDTNTIVASEPVADAKTSDPARATAPGKSRKAIRRPEPGVSSSRK